MSYELVAKMEQTLSFFFCPSLIFLFPSDSKSLFPDGLADLSLIVLLQLGAKGCRSISSLNPGLFLYYTLDS